MGRKTTSSVEAARLRRQAEASLRTRKAVPPSEPPPDVAGIHEDPRRLLHELQEHQVELEMQYGSLQEDERKRVSRELHDQISQTLVGIQVHLENLSRDSSLGPRLLKRSIKRTQRLVEKSVHIVHEFARELRPPALDDLGLIATLRSFVKDFTERTRIQVLFTAFSNVEHLNNARRTVLYRVAQSALSNVAQHSHATHATLSIRQISGAVRMEVSDNGRAFDVHEVLHNRRNKRLGLIGMRERVEMVGGSFSVESAPGEGTTIQAEIPSAPVRRH